MTSHFYFCSLLFCALTLNTQWHILPWGAINTLCFNINNIPSFSPFISIVSRYHSWCHSLDERRQQPIHKSRGDFIASLINQSKSIKDKRRFRITSHFYNNSIHNNNNNPITFLLTVSYNTRFYMINVGQMIFFSYFYYYYYWRNTFCHFCCHFHFDWTTGVNWNSQSFFLSPFLSFLLPFPLDFRLFMITCTKHKKQRKNESLFDESIEQYFIVHTV